MKKHLSVLSLLIRGVLNKVLIVLLVMLCAQACVLSAAFRQPDVLLYTAVDTSRIGIIFGAAFIVISVFLGLNGCEFGAKQGYTLRRLGISEKATVLLQAAVNFGCYFLLWIAQLALLVGCSTVYAQMAEPHTVNQQTIMLAFYKSFFMHSIFPLSSILGWVRNVLLLLGMGICTALYPYNQRRRKVSVFPIVLAFAIVNYFALNGGIFALGNSNLPPSPVVDGVLSAGSVWCAGFGLIFLKYSEVAYE